MSIKHAVLGLISEQSVHGYRLKEIFDERISPMWGLTTGQIYQTLSALERTGFLASRGERVGSRPARRIYSLTDAGKRELTRWLRDTRAPSSRSFRTDLPIRLMLLGEGGAEDFCRALDRREHEALHLHSRVTQMPRAGSSSEREMDVLGVFLDAMAHQLDADLKTLRRCREEVARWIGVRKPSAGKLPATSMTVSTPIICGGSGAALAGATPATALPPIRDAAPASRPLTTAVPAQQPLGVGMVRRTRVPARTYGARR